MTHFVVIVIVPLYIYKRKQSINAYTTSVLAKYSEHLKVTPYVYKTKDELEQEYDKYKHKYQNYDDFIDNNYGEDSLFDDEGNLLSTYNNNALFDWWVIGGRWSGLLTDNDNETEDESIEINSVPVTHLLSLLEKKNQIYHHIIDRNGILRQSREMGWFASYEAKVNQDEWKAEYKKNSRRGKG